MLTGMMYQTVNESGEVIMPTKVVLITSAIYAGLLAMSEFCLFYWHASSGTPLTIDQITITALITSAVSLPAIGYFVYRSEDALANLKRLERITRMDTLTGVLNRRSFEEQANGHISSFGLDQSAGTFLFIDVDHFKALNEEFGHVMGDKILAAIGASLMAGTYRTDVIGRLGADEFGVLLPTTAIEDGVRVAERLHRVIAQNCHSLDLGEQDVTVSIGLAPHRAGTSLAEVMRAADRQLLAAKKAGRDQICANTLRPVA